MASDEPLTDSDESTAPRIESEPEGSSASNPDGSPEGAAGAFFSALLERQHGALVTAISPIAEELASLRNEFTKRLAYDATKEDAFSRLYREMDESRAEQKFHQFRPIYLDLILLLDRIEQNYANVMGGTLSNNDFAPLLKSLYDEVLEILFRGEVEPITQVAPKFDPASQRAVGVEIACEQHEHHDVARVVRRGFKFRDHVLRPEEVIIKKLT